MKIICKFKNMLKTSMCVYAISLILPFTIY